MCTTLQNYYSNAGCGVVFPTGFEPVTFRSVVRSQRNFIVSFFLALSGDLLEFDRNRSLVWLITFNFNLTNFDSQSTFWVLFNFKNILSKWELIV